MENRPSNQLDNRPLLLGNHSQVARQSSRGITDAETVVVGEFVETVSVVATGFVFILVLLELFLLLKKLVLYFIKC